MRRLRRLPLPTLSGRSLIIALSMLVGACASPLSIVPKAPSVAFDKPWLSSLGQTFRPALDMSPGASGFHLLVSGQEGFAARVALTQAAQQAWDELVEKGMRLRESAYAKRLQESAFGRRVRDGRIELTLAPAQLLADRPADPETDIRSGIGSDPDAD